MANNADFAGPGGAVAEDDKNMSYQNKEQVGSLEQELERTEQDFRKAAESNNMQLVMQTHNRLCQLVAALSAAWSGTGNPTVFSRFHVATEHSTGQQSAASTTQMPASPPTGADELDIAALEKQVAELASKMQKCLEAGDMDGMLQANEKMGELSELMAKAEARQKAAKQQEAKPTDAQVAKGVSSGSWAAGDTMALAKQRAEERKKQQRLADSSFDLTVGEVTTDLPAGAAPAAAAPAGAASSADQSGAAFLNDRMKAKMKETGDQKLTKKSMTQDQLREKLEQYSFYEILSIPSTASFEELHRSFLRKIKKLNAKLYSKELEDWQFQEFVASLCLAHDVLKFPNARLQYDLVLFGPGDGMSPETTAKQKLIPLREMVKFSTLVNAKDLADAVEETKGTGDERDLGRVLVSKAFLSSEEFDSILFAQKLVSKGKLTVAQFELAMQEMRESNIPLLDTLIASEWIQPHEVFSGELN